MLEFISRIELTLRKNRHKHTENLEQREWTG